MIRFYIFFVICAISYIGCATRNSPDRTLLQIRELQTKYFETSDVTMVMKAMFNVLQDEGYMLRDANLKLGLLSADKEIDIENSGEALIAVLLVGRHATWAKNSKIEVTTNITQRGNRCKVRANFQLKKINNKGELMSVESIPTEDFYRAFYTKVSKSIFLQQEGL